VGHYEGSAKISDGGATVSGTLDVAFVSTPPSAALRFDLHGDCSNALVLVDVYPTVIATVYLQNGAVLSQVRVDIGKTPARGINANTHAGHSNSVTIAADPYVLPAIREVTFQMFDRGP
jgi:hypothetical protein